MIAVTVFFLFLIAWLCLPFIPGMVEIRKKTDAYPLKVVQEYDVDVHFFANVFREYVMKCFSGYIGDNRSVPETVEGKLEDDTRYYILGDRQTLPLPENEINEQMTHSMLIAAGSLELPGAMSYLTELYATDSIHGGNEDIFRALLAEKNIDIAEDSLLLRWMHAGNTINVKQRSVLHGRVSADHGIYLSPSCHFERLYSPMIVFGDRIPERHAEPGQNNIAPEDLASNIEIAGGRWLIEQDLDIPDNSIVDSNLVVIGRLNIGSGCRINGSVKSRKLLHVGQGTVITGSLVSNKDIYCSADCSIAGPLVSEEGIYMDSGAIIGSREEPATVSAENIHIKTNSVAYGLVWARTKGVVEES